MSVARHTIYNFAGSAIPLMVSLVTVPIYLSVIGLDRYGLVSICWLLLGYFNLFDFGLGRATAQKIATLANGDPSDRSRTFWTAALLSSGLALLATLLFAPAAHYGLRLMKLDSAQVQGELTEALPWLVAAVPFGIVAGLLTGALEGRRAFLKLNLINLVGTIATSVLPLLAALVFGPRLWHLLAASLAARFLVIMLLAATCWRVVPLLAPKRPATGEVRQLLRFGGWTTVTNVIGPLLVFFDRFAIGAVINSTAVGLYVVPFNLVGQLQLLPGALAGALFPRMAAASSSEAKALTEEGMAILAFFLTPVVILVLLVSGPFLILWLGAETGSAGMPVAAVLIFGLWANGFARLPLAALQGQGKPHRAAAAHAAELIPYMLVLLLSLKLWGIVGAAFAWSLRCVVDALAIHLLAGGSIRSLRPLALHGLVVLLGIIVALSFPIWSAWRWALLTGLLGIACGLAISMKPARVTNILVDFKARKQQSFDRN